MNLNPSLLLALLLCACGQSKTDGNSEVPRNLAQSSIQVEEAEAKALSVLSETGDATWVSWPTDPRFFSGTDKPCLRVSEKALEPAIRLLSSVPARRINGKEYEELTGRALTRNSGTAYLLRGFATDNSTAHASVTGDTVTVHSDALGGLFNMRRYPCVAVLDGAPATVFTVVAYDM
jgi:hypothetical protein